MAGNRKKPVWSMDKVDELLSRSVEHAQEHYGKEGIFDGQQADDRLLGLPMPSLAPRHLFQSTVFPLSRITELAGVPGCGKSTLLDEIIRWHRLCGGRGAIMDAEDKDNADMRQAILNYDSNAVLLRPCEALEDWQEGINYFIGLFQKLFLGTKSEPGPGRVAPIALGVDSIMGKAARETQDKVRKKGHAERNWAIEANLISTYMRCMPQLIAGWPFSVIGVNHWKPKMDERTGRPTGSTPGGFSPKFHETFRILVSKVRSFSRAKFEGYTVQLKTDKNSLGPDKRSIYVNLIWWYELITEQDEEGKPITYARQHAIWDWEAAAITCLLGFSKQATLHKAIMEVCDLHVDRKASTRVWSNALGIPSSDAISFREAGKALEARPDILCGLYPLLGIKERRPFQPGTDYLLQQERAMTMRQVRDTTHEISARLLKSRAGTPGSISQASSADDEADEEGSSED